LRGKPFPDCYLRGADLLGRAPRDCLVLEDSPSGNASARAAGMEVWAVNAPAAPSMSADRAYLSLADAARDVLAWWRAI
jgi:mannitol-1-/sugar-/sorbitol-6-phosphatase